MKIVSKKKIAFFSTTRAEFGLIQPLLSKIYLNKLFISYFFVGGSHLVNDYGKTILEIKNKKIKINEIFNFYSDKKKDNKNLIDALAKETKQLNKIFQKFDFDTIIILGDRYELLPIVTCAILYNKKIVHIGGGEKTLGIIDEQVRNMVSKSAHLHFTSNKYFKKQLINMDENYRSIFNVGSLSTENIKKIKRIDKKNLFQKFKIDIKLPLILMTYHSTTLEFNVSVKEQINNIFKALEQFNFSVIITGPNIEKNSDIIKNIKIKNTRKNKNYQYFDSLGFDNYHQLMKYSNFVIGNSSSGIIETPYYKIPTVNVGIRQKKRLRHISIIDCNYQQIEIVKSIKKASSENFKKKISNMKYLFGNGNSSEKIIKVLEKYI